MSQIVGPLLSDTGYVSADESTGNLVVRDTVEKLMQIEMIITEFDVPEAEQTVTDIFEIRNGDPSEIVQLLRMLISGDAEQRAQGVLVEAADTAVTVEAAVMAGAVTPEPQGVIAADTEAAPVQHRF